MSESIDWDAVRSSLSQQPGHSAHIIDKIIGDLRNLSNDVSNAFVSWWHDGRIDDLDVSGYSMSRLIDEWHMTPINALLTLDWLITDPDAANAALDHGRYDAIVTSQD